MAKGEGECFAIVLLIDGREYLGFEELLNEKHGGGDCDRLVIRKGLRLGKRGGGGVTGAE